MINATMQLDDYAMLLILTMTEQMIALRKWEAQSGMKIHFTISSTCSSEGHVKLSHAASAATCKA